MDRTAVAARLPWIVLAVAVAAEVLAWALGPGSRTETFAWDRVAAHAGPWGFGGAVVAALVASLLPVPRARWLVLPAAALAVHALVVGIPQAQPDTVNYLVYAHAFAEAPLQTLLQWPDLAWEGPQARFHKPFPAVPLLYGLAFAALGYGPHAASVLLAVFAVALPLSVALLGTAVGGARVGWTAGILAVGVPFLQAQAGWLLVDVPFTVALCLAWTALLRARDPKSVALAAAACALPLTFKISAGLFLAGPVAATALRALLPGRRRPLLLVLVLGLLAIAALIAVDPPRPRSWASWGAATFAIALHLRASLAVLLPMGLWEARRQRFALVALGAVLAVPVVVLYAPVEHAPRYAMPLLPLLCVAAALAVPTRAAHGLAAAGIVLFALGYRPLLVHHQAENVRAAVRALEEDGVRAIEVWGDHPGTTFPPVAVAILADFYAEVPVRYGGRLRIGPPATKRRWWEFLETPDRLAAESNPAPDGILLSLYGSGPAHFDAEQPVEGAWTPRGTRSIYAGSSVLWPRSLVLYRRELARSDRSE